MSLRLYTKIENIPKSYKLIKASFIFSKVGLSDDDLTKELMEWIEDAAYVSKTVYQDSWGRNRNFESLSFQTKTLLCINSMYTNYVIDARDLDKNLGFLLLKLRKGRAFIGNRLNELNLGYEDSIDVFVDGKKYKSLKSLKKDLNINKGVGYE